MFLNQMFQDSYNQFPIQPYTLLFDDDKHWVR